MTSAMAVLAPQTTQPTSSEPSAATLNVATPEGFQVELQAAQSVLAASASRGAATTATPRPGVQEKSRPQGEDGKVPVPPAPPPAQAIEPVIGAMAQTIAAPAVVPPPDSEHPPMRPSAGRKVSALDTAARDDTGAAAQTASTFSELPTVVPAPTAGEAVAPTTPSPVPAATQAIADADALPSATPPPAQVQPAEPTALDPSPGHAPPKPPDGPTSAAVVSQPRAAATTLPQPPAGTIRRTGNRAPTDGGVATPALTGTHRQTHPTNAAPSPTILPTLPPALSVATVGASQAAVTLSLAATPPSASHAATQASTGPPPHTAPVQQITPALLSVAQGTDGSQRMTVRLNPAELGLVQVRIDRSAAGTAHVEITAERLETLQTLQEDQAEMHRTLDHAGVPTEGRTLVFHVAASSQPPPGGNSTSSGGSGNPNGHGTDAGTFYSSGSNRQTARDQGGAGSSRRPTLADAPSDAEPIPQRWQRVGLDITA